MVNKWGVTIQPLTPLLREEGLVFEAKVTQSLKAQGERVEDLDHEDAAATLQWMRNVRDPIILLQPSIQGRLGCYSYVGRADVLRLWRKGNKLYGFIADIKASRKERTEHRIQVAAYAHLLHPMADEAGVQFERLTGGVLHVQPDGMLPKLDPSQGFDLEPYETSLRQLAVEEDCTVDQVAALPFADVPYHLGYHCDGCLYNQLCMYDSAERQDISLTPYLTNTEKRVLEQHGIRRLPQLAELMDVDFDRWEMAPAPVHSEKLAELANAWPVNLSLPILVQRARAALYQVDKRVAHTRKLLGVGFPTLPDETVYPELVKVFFDVQFDYLTGYVYLMAALIVGPLGKRMVVRYTEGPPTHESECQKLTEWVSAVLHCLGECANGDAAPIHLYCYNSYDQRVLLEAMKRHLSEVALLPGFFDLLTQHPTVDQPMITFLAREVEAHKNLGTVCAPLHSVAGDMYDAEGKNFDWTYQSVKFYELFRARLFDNRRNIFRAADGTLQSVPAAMDRNDPRRFRIESASRFNSQIPLEYFYAAWGRLPEGKDGQERGRLAPFRQVTMEDIKQFAGHRCRALAHIERCFEFKSRYVEKKPLDLSRLTTPQTDVSLAQSLREFIVMEHHASVQAKLQNFALPIERRMQTGLALLLRFTNVDKARDVHRFEVAFADVGLDAATMMNRLRLKEGDWVVLNRAQVSGAGSSTAAKAAGKIKNGRLAIVKAAGSTWVELSLKHLTFNSQFRYYHDRSVEPALGQLYTIDEMVDDLNADKQVDALAHESSNTLYTWLNRPPEPRVLPSAVQQHAQRFIDAVNELEKPNRMTAVQRKVVSGRLEAPLLLLQGPPGTGKSHTIGWAVLNRLLLAAVTGRPCRVAVACKTHNAVNIVLESISKKWRKLAASHLRGIGLDGMGLLRIIKLVSDESSTAPAGVEVLDPFKRWAELDDLLDQSFVVIGGTPGNLYNVARYRRLGGKKNVDWSAKPFDLLVIDEASQMSVPEAVLAGAFLREDGSMLVVGDHRQMPPIVQHAWEQEEKHSVMQAQPFLSLFEYLKDRGFPRESLDQSFRLHHTIATFLRENIYARDKIEFFSKRADLLDRPFPSDPFVDIVMAPEFPIVVIEHTEHGSQQYNKAELELVGPLIQCAQSLRLDGTDGVGVVVPHRAQKSLFRTSFPALASLDAIDTVERFQGGERDLIIVSATASDPDYVLAEADFLLNLNRLNVALSRPRKKLIVVASQSVTRLLLSDLDVFDNAVIWKRLYFEYANRILWRGVFHGVPVIVRGTHASGSNGVMML